jgi:hypothetical protein
MSIYGNRFDINITVNTCPYNHVVINNYYDNLIASLPDKVDDDYWYYIVSIN